MEKVQEAEEDPNLDSELRVKKYRQIKLKYERTKKFLEDVNSEYQKTVELIEETTKKIDESSKDLV